MNTIHIKIKQGNEKKTKNNKIVNETETFWIAEAQLIYY